MTSTATNNLCDFKYIYILNLASLTFAMFKFS